MKICKLSTERILRKINKSYQSILSLLSLSLLKTLHQLLRDTGTKKQYLCQEQEQPKKTSAFVSDSALHD